MSKTQPQPSRGPQDPQVQRQEVERKAGEVEKELEKLEKAQDKDKAEAKEIKEELKSESRHPGQPERAREDQDVRGDPGAPKDREQAGGLGGGGRGALLRAILQALLGALANRPQGLASDVKHQEKFGAAESALEGHLRAALSVCDKLE